MYIRGLYVRDSISACIVFKHDILISSSTFNDTVQVFFHGVHVCTHRETRGAFTRIGTCANVADASVAHRSVAATHVLRS